MKTFGEYLYEQYNLFRSSAPRKEDKQKHFASWLEVKPTSLSQWMSDERLPDIDNLKKLRKKLGTSVYIYAGLSNEDIAEIEEIENPLLRRIAPIFHALPREMQEKIARYTETMARENRQDEAEEEGCRTKMHADSA